MKKKIIGLIVLALAVSTLSSVLIVQRRNIKAVIDGAKFSSEEISEKIAENRAELQTEVEMHEDIHVRGLTEAEADALAEGSVSREELVEKLIEPMREQEASTGENEFEQAEAVQPTQSEKDEAYKAELSELVAETYILRVEYTAKLDEMAARAKAEYAAKNEKEKSKTALLKWAADYVKEATELEKQCDGEIDVIALKMLALLEENDADTSIVDELYVSYAKEKSLKKSWYISELQKRGLL